MNRIMLSAHKGINVNKSKDKSTTGRSKDQLISLFGEALAMKGEGGGLYKCKENEKKDSHISRPPCAWPRLAIKGYP